MENRVLPNRMVIPGSMIFCPTQHPCKMDIPNWKKPNKGTVEWIFQVYQSPQVHSTVKSKKAFPACILVFIKVSGPSILQGLFQQVYIYNIKIWIENIYDIQNYCKIIYIYIITEGSLEVKLPTNIDR